MYSSVEDGMPSLPSAPHPPTLSKKCEQDSEGEREREFLLKDC
jgi:hypothetical protein